MKVTLLERGTATKDSVGEVRDGVCARLFAEFTSTEARCIAACDCDMSSTVGGFALEKMERLRKLLKDTVVGIAWRFTQMQFVRVNVVKMRCMRRAIVTESKFVVVDHQKFCSRPLAAASAKLLLRIDSPNFRPGRRDPSLKF